MSRTKKYKPKPKYNPIIQANKIEELRKSIEQHKKELHIVTASYDKHVEYLSNFARHDMKNAIQSLDSIVSTTEPAEFNNETIISLKSHLKSLRATLDNFSKLVPYSDEDVFSLLKLLTALEVISRSEIQENKIEISFEFNRESDISFDLPFQAILQMLHNLIINAIISLKKSEFKKIIVSANTNDNKCNISIKDTGIEIPKDNERKIFEYKYTTTGGTGIGLFHAEYVCNKINGNIELKNEREGEFTKEFFITLPIKK